MKIHGDIHNGAFSNQQELDRCLRKFEGKGVVISVAKRQAPRTLPQNNYLWGVCYREISDKTGYTADELHEEIEALQRLRTYTDEHGVRRVKPTSQMSVDELSAYIDKIKLWAWHTLNCHIPDPE